MMNSQFLSPLFVSLQIALVGGAIAIITGIICAFLMTKHKFRGQLLVEIILLMPIVLPPSVIGFLLLVSVGASSPISPVINLIFGGSIIFTKTAAIIAASIVAFPIMYQAAKICFMQIDHHLIEAARLDKASEFEIASKIILPVSKYGLISGGILAFARAFGEFGATLMVAGNIPGKTETLPIAIYMAMAANDRHLASVYVVIMIITSAIFLIATNKFNHK